MQRIFAFIGVALMTILMIVGKQTLLDNLNPAFEETDEKLKNGQSVVLNKDATAEDIYNVLNDNNLMGDNADRNAASKWIASRLSKHQPANLGAINAGEYKISAEDAQNYGGSGLRSRLKSEYQLLGFDEEVAEIYRTNRSIPSNVSVDGEGAEVTVRVVTPSSDKSTLGILSRKLIGGGDTPESGVLVKAREHFDDPYADSKDIYGAVGDSIVAYGMTDSNGEVTFRLPKGRYYSFVPVKQGFQYGVAQGTKGAGLEEDMTLKFRQQPHTLKLFDSDTYNRIKEDNILIVRTPAEFKSEISKWIYIFIGSWWLLFIYLAVRDYFTRETTDYILPLVIMALTGIGLLTMFSLANPLTDKLLGVDMGRGLIIGLIAMVVIGEINFVNYYNGDTWIQRRMSAVFGRNFNTVKGLGYLIIAIILIIILAVAGTGPEGSDAKVNLSFGITFQPSEITKYLIVLFLACFFARNATLIQSFSERVHSYSLKRQWQIVGTILFVIIVLALMYMKLLSDMGPALVVVVTFIILYSVARKDLWQLFFGFLSFLAVLWIGDRVFEGSAKILWFVLGWFVLWAAGWWVVKKRIYESAMFMNIIVAAFLFGGYIIGGSEGERLLNRSELAGEGAWDNEVKGGDQIAHGVWSLATGGIKGQGLGRGNANLVPAFHTDMVFTGIGEIMGFVALLLIIICFAILIHRCLLIGRRNGNPFAFFLIAGIALVIGVQFAVIVCGSLGLIPLTGVSVPFLSYGQSSLIINMVFIGIIIGLSRKKATVYQAREIRRYDNVVVAGVVIFAFIAILIGVRLLKFQYFDRDEYLVKPAMITDVNGNRMIEYNPRIRLLMKRLDAGNIYDRKGRLLATTENGKRVYPYGDHTLFMLGDMNNRVVWDYSDNDPRGLIAENRYLNELRGFDNLVYDDNGNVIYKTLLSKNHHRSPFMPADSVREQKVALRDYSDPRFIAMLKEGGRGNAVDQWNDERHSRDLTLTIDAELQKSLQDTMAAYFSTKDWEKHRALRASVVVLNANNGDLLASANYPLPSSDTIAMLNELHIYAPEALYEKDIHRQAFTERDLGMTYPTPPGSTAKVMSGMAGLQRFDTDMENKNYVIYRYQTVEPSEREPNLSNNALRLHTDGKVHLDEAIRYSSNSYFVKLIHENDLYPELRNIYQAVGASVDYPDESKQKGRINTYFFNPVDTMTTGTQFADVMNEHRRIGNKEYDRYNRTVVPRMSPNSAWAKNSNRLASYKMSMAWGQGGLFATPLNMARVASIVANGGKLQPTRYVSAIGDSILPTAAPIEIISPQAADIMKKDMQLESDKHRANRRKLPLNDDKENRMGGKTGTPERDFNVPDNTSENKRSNDAWYICFIQSDSENAPLAIAVRIERSRRKVSTDAVNFMANIVIDQLNKAGYEVK